MRGNMDRELLLRLALMRLSAGNPRVLQSVLAMAPSVASACDRLRELPAEVGKRLAPLCVDDQALRAMLSRELRFLADDDAYVLTGSDPEWPPLLGEMPCAPSLLFCRGDVSTLRLPMVAIVGSRHASPAGLALARAFAGDLAGAGFAIVSGMALGIDAMAHEGALAAGGKTVAVLGCGVDVPYPRRHAALAARIRTDGCLLGEFLPGTEPLAAHFPQRNRIISGLSLGVLVVEATPDSGSLITARFAAEQGRDVFAVPGSVHSPTSRGCHQLIREGATLIESSAQLVEALMHFARPQAAAPSPAPAIALSAAETRLVRAMSPAGSGVDELAARTGFDAAETVVLLNTLLLRGAVHALPGGRWQPVSPC